MTALLPARRRAEAFAGEVDALLADDPATQPGATDDSRFTSLLEVVSDLVSATGAAVEPRDSFTTDLRTRLMLAAETDLVPTDQRLLLPPTDRHGPRRRRSRLATAVATVAVVAGTAGVAVASSHSVPGDPLHPVKVGAEQVRSALSFGDAAQGRTMLARADARLDEISRMVAGAGDRSRLPDTMDAFTTDASRGSDLLLRAYDADAETSSLTSVSDFVHAAMDRLVVLADGEAPAWMSPMLADAAQALTDADQEVRTLCVGCDTGAPLRAPAGLGVASGSTSAPVDPTSIGAELSRLVRSGANDTTGAARTTTGPAPSLPDIDKVITTGAGGDQSPLAASGTAGNGQMTEMLGGLIDDGLPAGTSNRPVSKLTRPLTGPLTKAGKRLHSQVRKGVDGVSKGLRDATDGATTSLGGLTGLLGLTSDDD